ncbi:RlpA-like lipoprotein [Caballeronia calidae]|uniref:Endolytic peptidoglycan transglycosylase RlpA n=1 Tax=Caballeronia calidae TaxID=1777139 RepID=A0A157ZME9_9BURK|nr:septal ring lytic transglycosylase RlpA family protein [Caballeronia calidae]SAK46639.1 RlpA-like lipoprotein [Caballeronia calidae]
MQDNRIIMQWRAVGLAAVAASGACAALSACAGHAGAQPVHKTEAEPSEATDASAVVAEGARVADAMNGRENNSLESEPLDYRSATTNVAAEIGRASYYSSKFQGHRTASGERYDMRTMTAAHRTLPFGSYVRVSNLARTRSVIVRVNDRGPFVKGRVIDLSFAAATELGLQHAGSADVILEPLGRAFAQAEKPKTPERMMLRIAPHPRHHKKHAHHR